MTKIFKLIALIFTLLFAGCSIAPKNIAKATLYNGTEQVKSSNDNEVLNYKGDIKDGIPHGKGKYSFNDGASYEGGYKLGKKNGNGTFVWGDGTRYEGGFLDGKRSGEGKQIWADKKFTGSFRSYAALGKMYYSDRVIEGAFRFNNDSKYLDEPYSAKIFYEDKRIYEGIIKNSQANGSGIMISSDGQKMYSGIFENDTAIDAITLMGPAYIENMKKNQKCKTRIDGFVNNVKNCSNGYANGNGTAYSSDGKQKISGSFKNGYLIEGEFADLISKNSSTGEWKNSKIHGKCKIYQKGVLTYDGQCSEGTQNGKGICFVDGGPEACEYYANKRIDALYKNRLADLEYQKKHEARLKELEGKQIAINNNQQSSNNSVPKSISEWIKECSVGTMKYVACDKAGGLISNLGGFGSLIGSGASHMCKREVIEGNECMQNVPAEWLEQLANML